MYRTFPYIVLFVAVMLLQTCLFDNLTLSVYLNPMVYIAFLLLLPMETAPVALLLLGTLTGITADWLMGAAGENTIATVGVAFARPAMLDFLCGKETVRDGGIPSELRLGMGGFFRYAAAFVALHHLLFFLFESLSERHLLHVALQLLVSGTVSLGFCWLVSRIFTAKIVRL